jgi:hypothetical protein
MSNLGKELQQTILNLERLRDVQHPPSDDILAKLDILYQQEIELIGATVNSNSVRYKIATKAMTEAAKKTKEAIDDLASLDQVIGKVSNAIEIVTELLSEIV